MKKRIISVFTVLALVLSTGCAHKHEFSEATCSQAKTCIQCGETEGEPLSHSFSEGTCTEPRICSVCGAADGEASGHSVSIGKCEKCGEFVNSEFLMRS